MTTAHEPIKYLDTILNEEEKRCDYSHQWRNFTISRSGRFKSKNKKRDAVDKKLFDESATPTAFNEKEADDKRGHSANFTEKDKASTWRGGVSFTQQVRDKKEQKVYNSYYETNL